MKKLVECFACFRFWPVSQQREFLVSAVRSMVVDNSMIRKITVSGGYLNQLAGAKLESRADWCG